MATSFSRIVAKLDTQDIETSLYTCPASTTAIIIGLRVSNANTSGESINYAVRVIINGGTAQELKGNYTGEDSPLPPGSGDETLGGSKLILLADDELVAECSHDDSLSVIMSFAEIS